MLDRLVGEQQVVTLVDFRRAEGDRRVFLDDRATDPTYEARRSGVFVVAVGCNHPGNTCFCVSMGTGPRPAAGYDLALTELYGPDRHEFLVDVGSDRGAEVLAALLDTPATQYDVSVPDRPTLSPAPAG